MLCKVDIEVYLKSLAISPTGDMSISWNLLWYCAIAAHKNSQVSPLWVDSCWSRCVINSILFIAGRNYRYPCTFNLVELRREQTAFLALQIVGGHIGLPILILHAIFSRTTHRDLTFLNFCFTWSISSVIFSIGWVTHSELLIGIPWIFHHPPPVSMPGYTSEDLHAH